MACLLRVLRIIIHASRINLTSRLRILLREKPRFLPRLALDLAAALDNSQTIHLWLSLHSHHTSLWIKNVTVQTVEKGRPASSTGWEGDWTL